MEDAIAVHNDDAISNLEDLSGVDFTLEGRKGKKKKRERDDGDDESDGETEVEGNGGRVDGGGGNSDSSDDSLNGRDSEEK